jgi:hypothetical protein
MQAGRLPSSPNALCAAISKPLPAAVGAFQPLRRWVRQTSIAPPRRSVRLAKKAGRRVPTVAAAQNVLMKRLGLVAEQHVESDDFNTYINLFRDGLSEEQARIIDDLFMDKPPAPTEEVVEEVA